MLLGTAVMLTLLRIHMTKEKNSPPSKFCYSFPDLFCISTVPNAVSQTYLHAVIWWNSWWAPNSHLLHLMHAHPLFYTSNSTSGKSRGKTQPSQRRSGNGNKKDLQARELAAPDTASRKREGGRKGQSSILLQEERGIHFHTLLPHPAFSSRHPHHVRAKPCGWTSFSTWVFLARGKTMFQC